MTEVLIGGQWLAAAGPTARELVDPVNRRLLETIRCASPQQSLNAYDAARCALEPWTRLGVAGRNSAVRAFADEIREVAGALAERQAIESGQPLRECQDLVASTVRRLKRLSGESASAAGVEVCRLTDTSLWPYWERVITTVATGSVVVCELPSDRALAALAVAHCARALPPGVLNVIIVDEVAEAQSLTDVPMDFVFVGADANLDVAVAGAAALRLYDTGQRVGQSARIYVEGSAAIRFADRLHEYLAFLEAGDPRKPVTDLGPLRSEHALERAIEQIGHALKRGALVKLGGRQYQPWGLTGFFLQPTVLVEGAGAERTPHEAISGPVVIVSPTTDIGAAIRQSAGASRSRLRLSAFSGQSQKLEHSLRNASFQARQQPYTSLVDRVWDRECGSNCTEHAVENVVEVELIDEAQADWFPYGARRGMIL